MAKVYVVIETVEEEEVPSVLGFWSELPSLEEATQFCNKFTKQLGMKWTQIGTTLWTKHKDDVFETTLWIEEK